MGAIEISGWWHTSVGQDALWQVVNDLSTWPAWWPAISDARPLTGNDGAPDAARLTFDTPAPLRPLVVELTVVVRAAPSRLEVRLTDGPLRGHATIVVTNAPDGAQVDYAVVLQVRSLLFKPIEPVLAGATRASGRARLARAGEDLARLAGGQLLAHG